MAKTQRQQNQEQEDAELLAEVEAEQAFLIEQLKRAHEATKLIFGDIPPTAEMVFGVYDRVYAPLGDDDED